mmetsp:Transcript_30472/g.40252  ORF Transcript_30472/g.40252 Transcript_30472/m.40252 type:complete len:117 (+) Transcript_30472:954-1304(+)
MQMVVGQTHNQNLVIVRSLYRLSTSLRLISSLHATFLYCGVFSLQGTLLQLTGCLTWVTLIVYNGWKKMDILAAMGIKRTMASYLAPKGSKEPLILMMSTKNALFKDSLDMARGID